MNACEYTKMLTDKISRSFAEDEQSSTITIQSTLLKWLKNVYRTRTRLGIFKESKKASQAEKIYPEIWATMA